MLIPVLDLISFQLGQLQSISFLALLDLELFLQLALLGEITFQWRVLSGSLSLGKNEKISDLSQINGAKHLGKLLRQLLILDLLSLKSLLILTCNLLCFIQLLLGLLSLRVGMIECVHLSLHISRGCRPSIVLLPHHSSVHRDSLVLRLLNFHQIVLYLLILNLQLLEGLLLFFQLLLVILDCNSELLIVKRV